MSGKSPPPQPLPWWRRFGRRNLGHLAVAALQVPAALAPEAAAPKGPDAGGGMMTGLAVGDLSPPASCW